MAEAEDGGAAMRALGPLMKLTQVFLWDDGTRSDTSFTPKQTKLARDDGDDDSYGGGVLAEGMELLRKMNDLGLPVSFQTNREKPKRNIRGKREGVHLKHPYTSQGVVGEARDTSRVSVEESASPNLFDEDRSSSLCGVSMMGQSESSCSGVAVDATELDCHFGEGDIPANLIETTQDSAELEYSDGIDSQKGGDYGDWMVYWDSYYMRNYFYNMRTHTSTWFPPEGMEHLEIVDVTCNSNEGSVDVVQLDEIHTDDLLSGKCDKLYTGNILDKHNQVYSCEEIPICCEHDEPVETLSMSNSLTEEVDDMSMQLETGVPITNELVMKSDIAVVKRKKKVRRRRNHRRFSDENEVFEGLLKECSADISKYWCQRYLLFSKYDDGIKMDEEGWFSVTPEALARHHAQRCGRGIIIDCFTGVGGNAIQFAQISKHVTAIDIDPTKIDYAQHNAAIYGVDERIDFIKGNFFLLASRLKADTVFLSPPWGGPDYAREETYDIMTMLKPYDGCFLFNTAKQVASKIVMFLPRNVDVNQLAELSLSATPPWSLEVEKNFVNGKLKGITAYFSYTEKTE